MNDITPDETTEVVRQDDKSAEAILENELAVPKVKVIRGFAVVCDSPGHKALAFKLQRPAAETIARQHEAAHREQNVHIAEILAKSRAERERQFFAETIVPVQRASTEKIPEGVMAFDFSGSPDLLGKQVPVKFEGGEEVGTATITGADEEGVHVEASFTPANVDGDLMMLGDPTEYRLATFPDNGLPVVLTQANMIEIREVFLSRQRNDDTSPLTTMQDIAEMLVCMKDDAEVLAWRDTIVQRWGQKVCVGCSDESSMSRAAMAGVEDTFTIRAHNCGK